MYMDYYLLSSLTQEKLKIKHNKSKENRVLIQKKNKLSLPQRTPQISADLLWDNWRG